ncbi:MAG: hypothetical protein CL505_06025 [Actinobacteria bacterium]|nr:hypothetical protein [Actinomycetota bacterium]
MPGGWWFGLKFVACGVGEDQFTGDNSTHLRGQLAAQTNHAATVRTGCDNARNHLINIYNHRHAPIMTNR